MFLIEIGNKNNKQIRKKHPKTVVRNLHIYIV